MDSRIKFTVEVEEVYQSVLKMAGLVEEAMRKAIQAFSTEDAALATVVIEGDDVIDALQVQIENTATQVIATESPVARDLRELITATKIAANLGPRPTHRPGRGQNIASLSRSNDFIDRKDGVLGHRHDARFDYRLRAGK